MPPPISLPPPTARTGVPRRICVPRKLPSPISANSGRAPRRDWRTRASAAREEGGKIRDQLGATPEDCLALAGVAPAAPLPALEVATGQLTRLKAERERLGGVNLQADDDLVGLSPSSSTA